MNEKITSAAELEGVDVERVKRDIRRTYNRCGWIMFAFTVFGFVSVRIFGSILSGASESIQGLISEYHLFYNAFLVALSTLVAAVLLLFIPKSAPERKKISAKEFVKLVFVSFGVCWIGGAISQLVIIILHFFSDVAITDKVSEALNTAEPWQAILCSVVIAPFTEEFLFRKLLIERLYKHGELVAILTSAVLFGLMHQNVYQVVYATGVGLVLGYLYCKTGSYLSVTALHMIVNLFGALPVLFTSRLAEFANMTQEELSALPAEIYAQYSSAMSGYITYSIINFVIQVVGVIILIVNRKKFTIENNAPALLESDKREIVIRAPGIVVAGVTMIILTVVSLFD